LWHVFAVRVSDNHFFLEYLPSIRTYVKLFLLLKVLVLPSRETFVIIVQPQTSVYKKDEGQTNPVYCKSSCEGVNFEFLSRLTKTVK
jgi:hypothetical protein